MTDVIEFLERMGRDAQLRHASEAVLEEAMRDAHLSAPARAALMGGDRAALKAVIGAHDNVCCMVNVPLPEGDDEESDGGKRQKAA